MKRLVIALVLVTLLLVPVACAQAPEPPGVVPAPMPSEMTEADEG